MGSSAFFPDSERLLVVVDRIRVALIQEGLHKPVIWSTVCGAGEELYGLAIAAVEELGPVANQLRIVGSDTDEERIETARHGIYPAESIRGLSRQVLDRHFQALGTLHWAVLPRFLRPAEFHVRSPTEMDDVLGSDSVLVAIHRPRSVATALDQIDRILTHMRPDGLLVLADDLPASVHPRLEPHSARVSGVFTKRPTRRPPVPTREEPTVVSSDSSVSTLPPPPSSNDVRRRLAQATVLGHHGHIEQALRLVDEALRIEPNGAHAYLVRAQLSLAVGSIEVALDDLRRLLFLAPSCRLARYWYALSLRASHQPRQALDQLQELERQLGSADDGELLEDETVTVGELRDEIAAAIEELAFSIRTGATER